MPILWQNHETVPDKDPEQSFAIGNQEDDVFAYIWSRIGDKPFRDTVRIRSKGMGGWNTTHSYEVLMRLAQMKLSPQRGEMQVHNQFDPKEWHGVLHQYSQGRDLHHLLTPAQNGPSEVVLGISNKANTVIHTVTLLQSHFGEAVFGILLELRDALRADNAQHGHWHDRLQSGE